MFQWIKPWRGLRGVLLVTVALKWGIPEVLAAPSHPMLEDMGRTMNEYLPRYYGFHGGVNLLPPSQTPRPSTTPGALPGFFAGIRAEYGSSSYLKFMTELNVVQVGYQLMGGGSAGYLYLQAPFLLRFDIVRDPHFRPYVFFGPGLDLLFFGSALQTPYPLGSLASSLPINVSVNAGLGFAFNLGFAMAYLETRYFQGLGPLALTLNGQDVSWIARGFVLNFGLAFDGPAYDANAF